MIIQLLGKPANIMGDTLTIENFDCWTNTELVNQVYADHRFDGDYQQGKLVWRNRHCRIIGTVQEVDLYERVHSNSEVIDDLQHALFAPMPIPIQKRIASLWLARKEFAVLVNNNLVFKNCETRLHWTSSKLWLTVGASLTQEATNSVELTLPVNSVSNFNCYTLARQLARRKPDLANTIVRVVEQITRNTCHDESKART